MEPEERVNAALSDRYEIQREIEAWAKGFVSGSL